jgi:2-methylisocitrate lyase-like PEP mutase family enzyme
MKQRLAITVGDCPVLMSKAYRSLKATLVPLERHEIMLEKFRDFVEQIREQFRLARVEQKMQEAELERLRERHQRRHPHNPEPEEPPE